MSDKCESYPRVMKYLKKRRPLKLTRKIEKDLEELKNLLSEKDLKPKPRKEGR